MRTIADVFSAENQGLLRFATSRLRNAAEAEDLVSRVWEQALIHQDFLDLDAVTPWLYRVLRNSIKNHWRAKAAHHVQSLEDFAEVDGDEINPLIPEALMRHDEYRAEMEWLPILFRAEIMNLTPKPRRALCATIEAAGEKSGVEIAQSMGIGDSAYKMSLSRARLALRERLATVMEI